MKTVVFIAIIAGLSIEANENLGLSCREDQTCIKYNKCPHALNIAREILTAVDLTEKEMLERKFKEIRCGNFSTEKTVWCDQDTGKTKVCSYGDHM